MPISLEKIEALAPDQSSLDAAKKLLKAGVWPTLATDGKDLVWGECQGSGSTPYRVIVCETDAGYKCSCPSRKFPCKHSLALMWLRAEAKLGFIEAETPAWVADWLSRRRGPSGAGSVDAKPKASIAAASDRAEEAPDPKAEARAAAARERNLKEREESVLSGLEELDRWIADQIGFGVAHFVSRAADACRAAAQRLVDAKAPGLATRIDGLPARLFAFPEQRRPVAAVQELAQLHLIAEAYRRQAELGEPIASDVRQVVGWNLQREQLLAQPADGILRVESCWRVVCARRETQPDRLIRQETWLLRQGVPEGSPDFALLLDFIPAAAGGSRSPYLVGETLNAELVFYPGILPLRALIARQDGPTIASSAPLDLPPQELAAGFADYETRLAQRPWLDAWPLAFRNARVRFAGGAPFLVAADGGLPGIALPFAADQTNLFSLSGLDSFDGVGLWDGHRFRLWWAETAWGAWRAA